MNEHQEREEREFDTSDYLREAHAGDLLPCPKCGASCIDPVDHCPPSDEEAMARLGAAAAEEVPAPAADQEGLR